MSNFQEELRNDDGYENIVIIAVGQTNISQFNNNFCANSDLPLVMDTHPDLPIRQQFSPYSEPHYLVILNYDGSYIGHIDLLSLGNSEKDYIRGVIQEHYQESYTGDINEDSLKNICDEFSVKPLQSLEELISSCEAVNIVTPTNTHFDIARKFLNQKKDVFIEKPITNTVEEALSLINLAKTNECIVQVGHIERFNPTINKLKELVDNPHYIEIERLAPFQARGTEVPVVLDLMVHDIDLILEMVNSPLESIQASGAKMMSNSIDLAHAHIKFQNGVVANLKSSRIAQNYVRKIRTYQKNFYSITAVSYTHLTLPTKRIV